MADIEEYRDTNFDMFDISIGLERRPILRHDSWVIILSRKSL